MSNSEDFRKAAYRHQERWHLWHFPAFLIAAIQVVLFAKIVNPLFYGLGLPRFLLSCYENWTGLYLAISAAANAVLRLIMWEIGYHEKVNIYPLSTRAHASLFHLLETGANDSAASIPPPLYFPIVARFAAFRLGIWKKITGRGDQAEIDSIRASHSLSRSMRTGRTSFFTKVLKAILHPIDFLSNGYGKGDQAHRWRPIIVLLHLGTEGRNFILTMLTGCIEALWYLTLTFFFSAQWGGNLLITFYALILLVVFITFGRMLSLIYVWWSSKVWGLHVVRCENDEQILGSLRVICAMQGVLVKTNGAVYFDGFRIDTLEKYGEWLRRYERGEFDDGQSVELADMDNVSMDALSVEEIQVESKTF